MKYFIKNHRNSHFKIIPGFWFLGFFYVSLASQSAFSSVPRFSFLSPNMSICAKEESQKLIRVQSGDQEINLKYLDFLSKLEISNSTLSADDIIPLSMTATNSQGNVTRKILSHSLDQFVSAKKKNKDFWGRSLRSMEKPLGDGLSVNDQRGRQHQLKMEIHGTGPSLMYKGIINAALDYKADSRTLAFEVTQKITTAQQIVLKHSKNSDESLSTFGYQITW